jgi:RimJ/RimL family protein N-acetyltransferase
MSRPMTSAPFALEGRRVRLVPLTLEHLDQFAAIGTAPELWSATTIRVVTRTDMQDYLQRALAEQAAGTAVPFAIVDRRSGEIVGSTRFHSLAPEHRKLEIGFTWIAPPWQRTGVNPESKFLLLRHAFEAWGCRRVQFTANAINERSRRAIERIGGRFELILRHHRLSPHLGPCDIAVYSIIASEWPEVRTALESRLALRA